MSSNSATSRWRNLSATCGLSAPALRPTTASSSATSGGYRRDQGRPKLTSTDAQSDPWSAQPMMSKFFIEQPVLANVLAIVMVLIGAVALYRAAGRRNIPNVVPPTVQVTTRYPGASAADRDRHRRAADRAAGQWRRPDALHAVDQRGRRHLYADRDLQHRHRSEHRSGAGAEPRHQRAGLVAGSGAGARRHRPEEEHRDPADRHARSRRTGATTACS